MTKIILSYHTHAQGAEKGWWGEMTHPAHFDEDWKEIKGTAWKIKVSDQEGLDEARHAMLEEWLKRKQELYDHPDMGWVL